jgi:hypothetical protein
MRFVCGMVILIALPSVVWAQASTGDAGSARASATTASADEPAGPVLDKKFWLTGVALNVSMIADTKSTFAVLRRCDNCVEDDPFAAPFVARGPVVAFAAAETFDVGVMVVAAKMKGSERPGFRRIWWVLPIALAAGHAMAYRHNLGVAR